MAMKKTLVVHLETKESAVHYASPFGMDYTLCGDTLDECEEEPELTNKRVTCTRCKQIVEYVRGK